MNSPPVGRGLTFALLGVFEHPVRFFADSKKTGTRSAAGSTPFLSSIFSATFMKVSNLGHARPGQVTTLHKKIIFRYSYSV